MSEATTPLPAPLPMLLWCPMCGTRHIDEGEFASKPHHTHACQNPDCGMVWRPAIGHTVGVKTLPGFLNSPPGDVSLALTRENVENLAEAALCYARESDVYCRTSERVGQYKEACERLQRLLWENRSAIVRDLCRAHRIDP